MSSCMICSFRDIVDLWGANPPRAAEALAADLGLPFDTVRKWRERNRIPADRWTAIAGLDRASRFGVTVAAMADLAAERRDQSDCETAGATP